MSRIGLLSWSSSAVIHVAVIAVMSTLVSVSPVKRPEIYGDRTVIDSGFTIPPPPATDFVPKPVELDSVPVEDPAPPKQLPAELSDSDAIRKHNPLTRIKRVVRRNLPRTSQATSSTPNIQRNSSNLPKRTTDIHEPVAMHRRPSDLQRHVEPVRPPIKSPQPHLPPADSQMVKEPVEQNQGAKPTNIGTTKDTPPRPISNPSPAYPADAVRQRLERLCCFSRVLT